MYPVYRETCKVHNLLHSFEVSNYHLIVICSANNHKNGQFHSLTVFYSAVYKVQCMLKDGMWKDGRKMLPTHVTLKVGVITLCKEMLDIQNISSVSQVRKHGTKLFWFFLQTVYIKLFLFVMGLVRLGLYQANIILKILNY